MTKSKIIYTKTDEAPMLATYSLLPIIQKFAAAADIDVELSDISLAARVLANFPEYLSEEQRVPDALAELGEMTQDPNANIIKLPNISASIPQLRATIKELNAKGFNVPAFPDSPKTAEEEKIFEAVYFNNDYLKAFNSNEEVLTVYSLFKIVMLLTSI